MKKKLLWGGFALLGVALLYGRKKYKDYSEIIEKMEFELFKFNRLSFKDSKAYINIDVKLINNSAQGFSASSSYINLKRIDFYLKGKLIAQAQKQINNIQLLPNNVTIIDDIDGVVFDVANTVLQGFESNLDDLELIPVIEILGKEYRIT